MLFRCVVPVINVKSPVLDFGRCFIRHPYERMVELYNDSDLPAKYDLVPQVNIEFHCRASFLFSWNTDIW